MSKAWEKMSRAGKILLVVASSIGFLLVTYIILIIINLTGNPDPIPLSFPCACAGWEDVTVNWTGPSSGTWSGACGSVMQIPSINPGTSFQVTSSLDCLLCQPWNYNWSVTTADGTPVDNDYGSIAEFTPTSPGCFIVTLNASCGSHACPPCTTHICICETQAETLNFTTCCGFPSPNPPSAELLAWIDVNYATRDGVLVDDLRGTRDCNDCTTRNKYWAHTFENLVPPPSYMIASATLTLEDVCNGDSNDSLVLGFISAGGTWDWWDFLTNLGVSVNSVGTIDVDLGAAGLLNDIANFGLLDVIVQDDSGVGCTILTITYVPQ